MIAAEKGRGGTSTVDYVLEERDGNRVGEVQRLNLGDDPKREMRALIDAASDLKRQNGVANPGQKTAKPIYHYALSWHRDDQPSAGHMMDQARATIALLGLQDHQALIVQHKNTPQPHVHIVINLIHPERGHTAEVGHARIKLNQWAYEYEAAHQFRTPKRATKHERTMTKPTTFDERKAELHKDCKDKLAKIKANHERARVGFNTEKDELWKRTRAQKDQIADDAQKQLDKLWNNRPKPPALEPKPPGMAPKGQEIRMWVKAMRLLKDIPALRPRREFKDSQTRVTPASKDLKPTFKHARESVIPLEVIKRERDREHEGKQPRAAPPVSKDLTSNFHRARDSVVPLEKQRQPEVPGKSTARMFNLARVNLVHEGRDVMLPIRNTHAQRQFASADKKARSDHIRAQRDEALKKCDLNYEKAREALSYNQAVGHQAYIVEIARFNRQADKLWKSLYTEFDRKYEAPDWVKKRQAWDEKVLGEPLAPEFTRVRGQAKKPLDIETYVDDYIAGKGRDSRVHKQFAANHAEEIEKEFTRRKEVKEKAKEPADKKPEPVHQNYRIVLSDAEAKHKFGQAIRDAGMKLPGDPEMDGDWHPVALVGEKGNQKAGGYRGFLDGVVNGQIRNHKTGQTLTWVAYGPKQTISQAEFKVMREQAAKDRQARAAELAEAREKARDVAGEIIDKGRDADPQHPYLQRKGVGAHGIKQDGDKLIIPRRDIDGKLHSFQQIKPDGTKLYQKDGRTKGTFHMIGEVKEDSRIYIAEGYATAASVHEATRQPVAVAFDKNNLGHVAKALQDRYPDHERIIAADNDVHLEEQGKANVGLEAAEQAAQETGAEVVYPPRGDWNDYAKENGLEATKQELEGRIIDRDIER